MDENDMKIQRLQQQIEKLNNQIEILQFTVELKQKRIKEIISICTEETEKKEESR